jgi:hypothetical protein
LLLHLQQFTGHSSNLLAHILFTSSPHLAPSPGLLACSHPPHILPTLLLLLLVLTCLLPHPPPHMPSPHILTCRRSPQVCTLLLLQHLAPSPSAVQVIQVTCLLTSSSHPPHTLLLHQDYLLAHILLTSCLLTSSSHPPHILLLHQDQFTGHSSTSTLFVTSSSHTHL